MARRVVLLFLLLSGLTVLPGCGKKGPIQVPLVRTPQTAQKFSVFQRGGKVFLNWMNPEATIAGSPIGDVAAVEIWLIKEERSGGGVAKKWSGAEFENKAELLTRISADQFSGLRAAEAAGNELRYFYLPEGKDFGSKTLTFALRVRDKKMRASGFTEPVSLELIVPPPPPQKVEAVVFEDHIQVRWEAQEGAGKDAESAKPRGYNIYRSEGESPALKLNSALIMKQVYLDKEFSFGRTYRYFIRTVLVSAPQVESEDSGAVEITAQDSFPPARPSGLTAIGGSGFIALSWEAGRESDLAGYRVWRRIAEKGEFVLIASLTATESSFQDAKVEKNRRYEYAISALDTAGNESQKSEPALGIMRNSPPV
jgi:predicted small lipoprotein YifL